MKHYNEKIANFLVWMKDGEDGDERFALPNRDTFELYRMENPEVEELTVDEGKYLDVLYKVNLINKKGLTPEVRKIALANDFGYIDRPKLEEKGVDEYVIFDTTGLDTEHKDLHENESFENEAVKNLGGN